MATSIALYVLLPLLFLLVVPGQRRPRVVVLSVVYLTATLVTHLCVPLVTGIARWESDIMECHFKEWHCGTGLECWQAWLDCWLPDVLFGVIYLQPSVAVITASVVQLALDARRPSFVVGAYAVVVPLLFQIADSWHWFSEWYTFFYWGLATWQHDFPWLLPMEHVANLAASYFLPPSLAALVCAVFGAVWLRREAVEQSDEPAEAQG